MHAEVIRLPTVASAALLVSVEAADQKVVLSTDVGLQPVPCARMVRLDDLRVVQLKGVVQYQRYLVKVPLPRLLLKSQVNEVHSKRCTCGPRCITDALTDSHEYRYELARDGREPSNQRHDDPAVATLTRRGVM